MPRYRRSATLSLVLCFTAAAAAGPVRAPLFTGLGDHYHPITTEVEAAQRYFDQGLALAWGFNHAEAERSFRAAAALDPGCAMCWWGVALVLGPNINLPMQADAREPAEEAIGKARSLAAGASPRERAYIEALARRYGPAPAADRSALDLAYAEAMRRLADGDLDDLDARVLYAEALMDTMPWEYWTEDGRPRPVTEEILRALESVLARDPDHIGALHLYIHTVEAAHPNWGVSAAERLGSLAPAAGHLVHMPGHIWIRVGRYRDARIANERAIAADDGYITQCRAEGVYSLGYMPHNHHFLWVVALLQGNRALALEQARLLAGRADLKMMRVPDFGWLQQFYVTPLFTDVAFGLWEQALAAPPPDPDLLYPRLVWHYARVLAFARTGELDMAARELAALERLGRDPALAELHLGTATGAALAPIAVGVAAGELAAARGDREAAIAAFREAVAREDALTYDEPPPWPLSARLNLGTALLAAGRPVEAEAVFRADLARFPDNGWALFGLAESLDAAGRRAEAAAVRTRFATAWREADVELAAPRM